MVDVHSLFYRNFFFQSKHLEEKKTKIYNDRTKKKLVTTNNKQQKK